MAFSSFRLILKRVNLPYLFESHHCYEAFKVCLKTWSWLTVLWCQWQLLLFTTGHKWIIQVTANEKKHGWNNRTLASNLWHKKNSWILYSWIAFMTDNHWIIPNIIRQLRTRNEGTVFIFIATMKTWLRIRKILKFSEEALANIFLLGTRYSSLRFWHRSEFLERNLFSAKFSCASWSNLLKENRWCSPATTESFVWPNLDSMNCSYRYIPLSLHLKGAQSDELGLVRYLVLRTLKIFKNSALSQYYGSNFLAHNHDLLVSTSTQISRIPNTWKLPPSEGCQVTSSPS